MSAKKSSLVIAIVVALLAALWLSGIGTRKLANPDEGRYSTISHEMAVSGDFVTPRLNGLKYFEKPAMQYWATAIAFNVFGENEWSARLYTALCGLLCILLVGYTGYRIGGRDLGLYSALALAACPYFMALAKIVTLDMGLTFWTTLSFCAFLISQQAQSPRQWLWLAWGAAAGAVLSKGLIGFLFPAAAMFLYCVVMRDFRRLLRLEWIIGLIVFFVVATPWFVMVSNANPEFAHFFFIHEHVERFLTTEHRRVQPAWFFIPILFLGALPWAFILLQSIWRGWKTPYENKFHPLRFALLWCAFIFLFFSASGSKLPAYLLPVFPPLALVIGTYIASNPSKTVAKWLMPIALLAMVGIAAAQTYGKQPGRDALDHLLISQYSAILMNTMVVLFVGMVIGIILLWRDAKRLGIAAIALTSVLMVEALDRGYEVLSPIQSGYEMSLAIQKILTPETRLYEIKMIDQSLPFYLKRNLTLVEYIDEFQLGIEQEPGKAIAKIDDFPADWQKPGEAIAIIAPGVYDELKVKGMAMEVIYQDQRRVAVAKPVSKPTP